MTKVEEKGRLKYSKFDKMDTDVLEAILRADFDAQEAERMEVETVIYISNLLAERREPPKKDTGSAKAEFFEYYYPLAGDEKSIYDFEEEEDREKEKQVGEPERKQKTEAGIWLRSWRRFASAVAILVLVVFGSGATAYALGFNPFPVRAVWYDEQFWFERVPVTQELADKATEYSGGIACVPKWLPEGYKAGSLAAKASDKYVYIAADFHTEAEDGQKEIYVDYRIYADPKQMARHEKDSGEVTEYVCNGIPHYIMSNLDRAGIVWYNENIEGSIKGEFSVDEAKRIIESIYGE